MAAITSLLNTEISRIARKESKRLVEPLRKQVATQRKDIAALKRTNHDLQRELAQLVKVASRSAANDPAESIPSGRQVRFSASGLQTLRKRLGLSAEDFGRLVEVSGQSVYNWEQEKSRPRQAQVERIAALRGIGVREARKRIAEALEQSAAPAVKTKKARRKAKAARSEAE